MKKITPIIRNGRWLATCPTHGDAGALPAESEYICPVCYPKIIAAFFVVKNGVVTSIPDRSARRTARMMAQAHDDIYTIEFPSTKEKIEKELEKLPELDRMWHGETLKDLKAIVKKRLHVMENYKKRDKSLDGKDGDFVIERRR